MEVSIKVLFIFGLYPILSLSQVAVPEDACVMADLGFVMDSSTTISARNFKREKIVIQGLTNAFQVKPRGSRAGLITFSNTANLITEIGQRNTASAFTRIVRGLRQTGGNTFINRAMIEATNNLFGVRYKEPKRQHKILFVLTDGKQTGWSVKLKILTRALRHLRVRIIAIAIGDNTNRYYLEQLVEHPRDILYVRSHSKVRNKVAAFHLHACSKPPGFIKKCSKRIDVGFALDASGSMGNKSFGKEREFVIDMLKQFELSREETNAGVIVYSLDSKLVIKLNEFYDLEKFRKALTARSPWKTSRQVHRMRHKWMNHKTRIDRALGMANYEFFTKNNGDRPDVRNVLIFLTDGIQNPPSKRPLEYYAKPLLNDKVNIIAVGFGKSKREELLKIASGRDYALSYTGGVEVLEKAVGEIMDKICNYCEVKVNLGFVLDASRTTTHKFDDQKKLTEHIAEGFVLKEGGSQATLSKFSYSGSLEIPFTHDLDYFKTELDFVTSVRGQTYIDKGLRAVETEYDRYAVAGRPNILLVMTDGRQTEKANLVKQAADDLRRKGIIIYAITTNTPYRKQVLRYIAGSDKNIMHLKLKGEVMETLAQQIVKTICPAEAAAES